MTRQDSRSRRGKRYAGVVPPDCFHDPKWAEKWLACRMNSLSGQNRLYYVRLFRRVFSVFFLCTALYAVSAQAADMQAEQLPEVAAEAVGTQSSVTPDPSSVSVESQTTPVAPSVSLSQEVPSVSQPLSGDALLHEFAIPPPPPPPRWLFTAETIPRWQKLDTGLELGIFPGRTSIGQALEMIILRIDPKAYDFSVLTVPLDEEARSLGDWADGHQLAAVINASMYLPDGRTSTGYLRSGEQVNNSRIVSRFGAFFVAGSDTPDMPGAALLDRTEDPWEALLPHYSMVVQNYRLISAGRRLLWNPGGPQHSIAAVGRDGTGAILFIHCREPLTGVDFGTLLLNLPIDIRLVMYVEGGSQAGLLVRTPQFTQTWMGRHPADIWTSGNEKAPLPNVIGIRKRQ